MTNLDKNQKAIARLIKKTVAGLSRREKLRAMKPKGIQKLIDDAKAELKEIENE